MMLAEEPPTKVGTQFVVRKVQKTFAVGRAAAHGARRVAIVDVNGDLGEVAYYRDYYHGECQIGFPSLEAARNFYNYAQDGQRLTLAEIRILLPGIIERIERYE